MHADPDADGLVAAVVPVAVVLDQLPLHGHRGGQRLVGPAGKRGHDGVADVLVDEASVVIGTGTELPADGPAAQVAGERRPPVL